ncbi:MAG: hypothetical protein N2749_05070 [Clostridia bacterium]|nr:hypothetical protein [Clostridia bacterium]
MQRYVIVDSRLRDIEKRFFESLEYKVICLEKSLKVYEEISSHVDIFCCKLGDNIITEPDAYSQINEKLDFAKDINLVRGNKELQSSYPENIAYNLCNIGNFVIHNFKYTDEEIKKYIDMLEYTPIQINQGYSKCSISIVNNNSCITCDSKIADNLKEYAIEVLNINEKDLNIKLLNGHNYSSMNGFIGGATAIVENKYVIFGDILNIGEDSRNRIIQFVKNKGLELIDFKGIDIVDYGGIITI